MKNNKEKHNGIISLWKFLFSIMIILNHTHLIAGTNENSIFFKGSIAVEFFFLVSGFLMAKKALTKRNTKKAELGKETFDYVIKKYLAFLPLSLISGFICLLILNIYNHVGLRNNLIGMWDILLLSMTGLKYYPVNTALWYISAMLLCMLIIYPLLRKYKSNYIYIVSILIVLFGLGYMNHTFSHLRDPKQWLGFTYKGVLRAFVELHLGTILYLAYEKIKNIKFNKLGTYLITIIEISGFIFPFIMAQFFTTKYDCFILIFLSISIVLAFSGKTKEYNILNNKFCYFLEKFSLPIYFFHYAVIIFVRDSGYFETFTYYQKLAFYIPVVFTLSYIGMKLNDYLKKNNYFFDKLKKLVTE